MGGPPSWPGEGGDLLEGGLRVVPWGPWREQWGLGVMDDVTGHVGLTGGGGYLRRWQIRWLPWGRGHGGTSEALGCPCRFWQAAW